MTLQIDVPQRIGTTELTAQGDKVKLQKKLDIIDRLLLCLNSLVNISDDVDFTSFEKTTRQPIINLLAEKLVFKKFRNAFE